MRKFICAVSIFSVLLFGLESCKSKTGSKTENNQEVTDAAHNSRNSVDWAGTYMGTIPCADCEGISVQITLNSDETYQLSYSYLGKADDTPETASGKFTWDEAGGAITLDVKDCPPYYKVGENKLIQLDMSGNPIDGELAEMYVLTKKE